MKENPKAVSTLNDMLHYNARVITATETSLKNSLHAWINLASALKLKEVLLKYTSYLDRHVDKMEGFFTEENVFPITPSSRVINALIEDTDEKIATCNEAELKDAFLLASVQEINHYKISLYGTTACFANILEMNDAASIFHEAEISEKQIDDRLSQLAEHEINPKAKALILISK